MKDLKQVDILHLYPSVIRGDENDGFWDSHFFDVWMFDTLNMKTCKSIRNHDSLFSVKAERLMVYQDGSIFIRLSFPVDPEEFSYQAPCLGEVV